MNRLLAGIAAITLMAVANAALLAQAGAPKPAGAATFSGCLQAAGKDGFVLLNPQGTPADNKTQTLTYKLVSADKALDFAAMANKQVSVTGTLDNKPVGNVAAPVPDSARGTGGAGGSGVPGKDNASSYVNGTLTAQSIRVINNTCATNDRK